MEQVRSNTIFWVLIWQIETIIVLTDRLGKIKNRCTQPTTPLLRYKITCHIKLPTTWNTLCYTFSQNQWFCKGDELGRGGEVRWGWTDELQGNILFESQSRYCAIHTLQLLYDLETTHLWNKNNGTWKQVTWLYNPPPYAH